MDLYYNNNNTLIITFSILLMALVVNTTLQKALSTIQKINQERGNDGTQINFIKNSLGITIFGLALTFIIYTIPELKALGTSLLAGAGILAAVIGFASQAAFSNIISGIFIILFKPFRVNDTLQLGNGLTGVVTDITFRHTIIKDFENKRIIIPNTIISNETIINSTIEDERIKKQILFSIGYDADIDLAMDIIRSTISEHPLCIDIRNAENLHEHKVKVILIDWAESSLTLRADVWTLSPADAFVLKTDILKEVKEKFDKNNITIPYPHRVIQHLNTHS